MDKIFKDQDDGVLFLLFQQGNNSCFEKILQKYKKPLVNFIYRIVGDITDAEDLAQEVFLKIYVNKDKYKPKANFSTWLYKIAINVCIDHKRKYKNKFQIISLDDPIKTEDGEIIKETIDLSQDPPDKKVEQEEINKKILSFLLSLPEKQRIALTLKVYENKSYKEISEILGCSVSSVESLIFRARQMLKRKISNLK